MAKVEQHGETLAPNDPRWALVEHRLVLKRLDAIEPKPVTWLWGGHVVRGAVNLWSGNPGRGKSTLAADFAARISTGAKMPFGAEGLERPAEVLLCNGEDDPETTILPRVIAAGGDRTKLYTPDFVTKTDETLTTTRSALFDLFHQFETILNTCRGNPNIRLVVIDPITAFMGDGDSNSSTDVRNLLKVMSEMARDMDVTFLIVTHQNKKTETSDPMFRVQGSIAWVGAARSAFVFEELCERVEGGIVTPVKINVCKRPEPIAYKIVEAEIDTKYGKMHTSKIEWMAEGKDAIKELRKELKEGVDMEAEPDGRQGGRTKGEQAEGFLKMFLAGGPAEIDETVRVAKVRGIGELAVRKAANRIGVETVRQGPGKPGLWRIPQ